MKTKAEMKNQRLQYEDYLPTLSYEEMLRHGISEITTELWIVSEGDRTLRGAVTEKGFWPNLYSLTDKGNKVHVDSAHIFRFTNNDQAINFFNEADKIMRDEGLEKELTVKKSGNNVRFEWFD